MANNPTTNHNVYVLGAGFSVDGGIPIVSDFLERMADSVDWLDEQNRTREADAIRKVFEFRLRAAGAAYRALIDVENIEELFSLASACEGEAITDYITLAIAATIDVARSTRQVQDCTVEKKKSHKDGSWSREHISQ